MDKNDSMEESYGARESSMNVQGPRAATISPTTEPVQPRGCPVMAFQAMISGKYKIRILWDLRRAPAVRCNQDRPAQRRDWNSGNRAPRAEPGAEGACRSRDDRAQGFRPRPAQGRISADGGRGAVRAYHRRHPRLGRTSFRRFPRR